MRFLDVKTDFAFKKVFGSEESKDVLISFLNALLEFPHDAKITDLTVVDPYQIPLLQGMKDTYVDVKAILSNKQQVIVEMQVLNVPGFEKRILYNAAKAYSTQLKKGESYELLNPVIALTVTDFVLFPEFSQAISRFRLLEKKELIEYSDDVELVFAELPKFNKPENQLDSIADKWLYFVKNAGSLEYVPETLKTENAIKKAFEIANYAGLSAEEEEAQHKRQDFLYLQRASVDYALERGIRQGIQQGMQLGIQQGEKNKVLETARKMCEKSFSVADISEVTGLSFEEIQNLVETLHTKQR